MKKNFKKILLGVGIGSVMCASTLFTGCTGAFTEDQNEDMMEVLENVEQFMDTTSKDLENMNSSMKDIVDQLHMLNKEYAFKLYNYAINSIYINKDNVWDNLKIKSTNNCSFAEETHNTTNEVLLYKKDNKNYIAYSQKTEIYEKNYYYTDNGS
jgi:hypothetical protein